MYFSINPQKYKKWQKRAKEYHWGQTPLVLFLDFKVQAAALNGIGAHFCISHSYVGRMLGVGL